MMNAKSRVQAALRREPADRVPFWMWFYPDTTRRLSELPQVPPARVALVMGDETRWPVTSRHGQARFTC